MLLRQCWRQGEWVDDLSQWVEEMLHDAGTTPPKTAALPP